jgi:CRP-like cAMP-binding protein
MFPGIADDDLIFLTKQGELRLFRSGSQLTRQGDVNRSIHIIMKGCVRIERFHPDVASPVVLAILGPGEVVVGAEVLGDQLASTSVTAIEDTATLEIEVRALAQAVLKYPRLLAMLLQALSHCTSRVDRRTEPTPARLDEADPSGRDADRQHALCTQANEDQMTVDDDESTHAGVAAGL